MTKREPSMLSRIIATAANRLAQDASIPPESRAAFCVTAISVFERAVIDLSGGERLAAWSMAPSARRARRDRIAGALAAGHTVAAIARSENVSRRWVEKLRAKLSAEAMQQ